MELLHIKLFIFSEALELVSLLITHQYYITSVKSSQVLTPILLFDFVLLHMTYRNSSFPSWSRVSSFTLTKRKKYSDRFWHPHLHFNNFYTTKNDSSRGKKHYSCAIFIHTLLVWNECSHEKFLKLLFKEILDNFSEKVSRNVNAQLFPGLFMRCLGGECQRNAYK